VSPLGKSKHIAIDNPSRAEGSLAVPETSIHVADDGWTTTTNMAPFKAHLVSSFSAQSSTKEIENSISYQDPNQQLGQQPSRQRVDNIANGNLMPMGGAQVCGHCIVPRKYSTKLFTSFNRRDPQWLSRINGFHNLRKRTTLSTPHSRT